MKHLILLPLSFFCLSVSAQTELLDWGKEPVQQETEIHQIEELAFGPEWLDNSFVISGTFNVPGKTADQIFFLILKYIAETYPDASRVLIKVDDDKNRIMTNTALISEKEKRSGSYYEHATVFQANDSLVVFNEFNFSYNTLKGGLSIAYKQYHFDDMFPKMTPQKSKYRNLLQETLELNNHHLSLMADYIKNSNEVGNVGFLEDIMCKRPVVGMNCLECILAMGKPQKINNIISEGIKIEQWVYPEHKYIHFHDGIIHSIHF